MKKVRKKIPTETSDKVIYEANRLCAICKKSGKQIHHIDEDPSNNDFENLIYLCYDCHEDATLKGGVKKRLSPGLLKKYRDEHYIRVEKKQCLHLEHHQNFFQLSRDAMVSIEVEKIKSRFNEDDWTSTEKEIYSLFNFPHDIGFNGRKAILNALGELSCNTRYLMPLSIAKSIEHITYHYLPMVSHYQKSSDKISKEESELLYSASIIGFNIAYDAIKYLANTYVFKEGIILLWKIFRYSSANKLSYLIKDCSSKFTELEELSKHRKDEFEIIKIFKEHAVSKNMSFPIIPQTLEKFFLS